MKAAQDRCAVGAHVLAQAHAFERAAIGELGVVAIDLRAGAIVRIKAWGRTGAAAANHRIVTQAGLRVGLRADADDQAPDRVRAAALEFHLVKAHGERRSPSPCVL